MKIVVVLLLLGTIARLSSIPPARAVASCRLVRHPHEHPWAPVYVRLMAVAERDLETSPACLSGNCDLGVAIVYRQPSCIPQDFDLTNFYDHENAYQCPLNLEGYSIYPSSSQDNVPPLMYQLRNNNNNNTIPIFFLSRSLVWDIYRSSNNTPFTYADLLGWAQDADDHHGVLAGVVTDYFEMLHPVSMNGVGGNRPVDVTTTYIFRGILLNDDGREFSTVIHYANQVLTHWQVDFFFATTAADMIITSQPKGPAGIEDSDEDDNKADLYDKW